MKRVSAFLVVVLFGTLVAAVTAEARPDGFSYSSIPVASDSMTLWYESAGAEGIRLDAAGPEGNYYGLGPNEDVWSVNDSCGGLRSGTIDAGSRCELKVEFTNNTSTTYRSWEPQLEWDFAGDSSGFIRQYSYESESSYVGPGDVVTYTIRPPRNAWPDVAHRYDDVGQHTERARLVVNGRIIDSFDFSYDVEARRPSAPPSGLVQFTSNVLSVGWPKPYDGGSPITGYLVYLFPEVEVGSLSPPPWPPYSVSWDIYTAQPKTLACNFTGRPELQICDLPNNQLRRIEAGDYRLIVMALTDISPGPATTNRNDDSVGYWWWSDTFTVANTLDNTPPPPQPEPEPEPLPTPEPEPTPDPEPAPEPEPEPDVITAVGDYSNAPNLVSLIHATNYSSDLDAPVLRLYQAYFNRKPDLLGIKYWLDVRRSGHNQLAIAGYMAMSEEFANNYEGVSDSEYLTRVYQNMLGRTYDQAGFNYWLDILQGRNDFGSNATRAQLSRSGVVFYVTGGAEFIAKYPYTS